MFVHASRALMVLAMVICTPLKAAEVIAHRGASKDAPENTLPAFQLAWEQGADAIELDVHLSADGRIVVIHDATTRRTTGVDLKVAETKFTDLRALDAGSWKGARWRGVRIPSLDEVLAAMPEGKRVFIEVKCGVEILPELDRVLSTSKIATARVTIIGFGYEVMKAAKARLPDVEVCWITRPRKDGDGGSPTADELIARAREGKLDGLDLDHTFAIDAAFVGKFRAANMKLYVWTVDKPADASRLRSAGVHGITSNVPARIRPKALGFRFVPDDGFFMKRHVSGVLALFLAQPTSRKPGLAEGDGPFLTAD